MCFMACSLIIGGFIGGVVGLIFHGIVSAWLKRKLNEIEGWMV